MAKGHGRAERCAIWVVASRELGMYRAQEYGWPGVCWIAGGHLPAWNAPQVLVQLRGHWEAEN
ncbi:MAG: hypothetical protein DDG58_07930, partial [Ardenticatenia bacterium]